MTRDTQLTESEKGLSKVYERWKSCSRVCFNFYSSKMEFIQAINVSTGRWASSSSSVSLNI